MKKLKFGMFGLVILFINCVLFGLVLFFSNSVFGQIPVTDGANLTNNITSQIQNFIKYSQQVRHLQSQIENQTRQINSITGGRGLGGVFSDNKDFISSDMANLINNIKAGNISSPLVMSKINQIKAGFGVDDSFCNRKKNLNEKQNCLNLQNINFANQLLLSDLSKKTADSNQKILAMQSRISSSTDQKELQEISTAIQTESLRLQTDINAYDSYIKTVEQSKRLYEQKRIQDANRGLLGSGMPNLKFK